MTPCELTIDRDKEFTATFTLGQQTMTIPVETTYLTAGSGASVAANVLTTGGVGLVADAVTGANLSHTPNPVHALFPSQPAAAKAPARAKKPAPAATGS